MIAANLRPDIQTRLRDDESLITTLIDAYDRVEKQYHEDIKNIQECFKINSDYLLLTEKRYEHLLSFMQSVKSVNTPPSIPQTIEAIPRFLFITYPWYWIRKIYYSSHFRQFMLLFISFIMLLAVWMSSL